MEDSSFEVLKRVVLGRSIGLHDVVVSTPASYSEDPGLNLSSKTVQAEV
jgi:hypothetical protein